MNTVFAILLLVVVLVVLAATGFAIALVRSSRKQRAADEAMPFISRAPQRWAVSHEPEAKLHRRLRDAVRALTVDRGIVSAFQLDEQVRITVAAQDLDEQLVTMSAVPESGKSGALARLETQVTELERQVAALLTH